MRISGVSGAGLGQAETASVCVEAQPDSRQRMDGSSSFFTGHLSEIGRVRRVSGRLGGFGLSAGLGHHLRARLLVGNLLRVDALDVHVVVVEPERPDGPPGDRHDHDQLEGPLGEPREAEQSADDAHGAWSLM